MKLGERAREKRASEGEIESTHELDGEREGMEGGKKGERACVCICCGPRRVPSSAGPRAPWASSAQGQ